MRLGTLARKISITPSKLTAFLESQNIDLSSGTNTKLTDIQIELVLEHYDASLEAAEPEVEQVEEPVTAIELKEQTSVKEEPTQEIEDVVQEVKKEESSTPTEAPIEENKEEISKVTESFAEIALPHELEEGSPNSTTSETEKEEAENKEGQTEQQEEVAYVPQVPEDLDPEIESYVERLAYDENIEVIKPAKVKLQGLTVKGKIDLPEPKVETETPEEPKKEEKKVYNPDEIITTTGPRRDRKRKPKSYKGKKFNKDYNPVEAARKKKEWEEKKRKEKEERRKKKAKELHYKKVVKPVAAAPATKKKPKKVKTKKKQPQQQPAGNMLQRFWRWMNT